MILQCLLKSTCIVIAKIIWDRKTHNNIQLGNKGPPINIFTKSFVILGIASKKLRMEEEDKRDYRSTAMPHTSGD